ncbi:Phosphoribosylformylglycinamidine cyclo-ligase [Elusimicrobium minutum Pei191]|uniref:Phosphoribosylformylglycinamidine cyclo-ligase n=1 Tax=Elusimicrobium minutum (strain Pei191) TaxID=445932 RepID=B2KCF5_ELUMP|nr:phosphoribosylformylglycinamidine cyclo-ligase [Elusimicrobium minutum]ACC98076.1 Phosphoribosylformylglycinamidine cyclo-ligase [Elusimicrobium minutum Pei191]
MSTYKKAGVDIVAGDKFVDFIATKTKGIGGFAGLMKNPANKEYSMVASTDGVGTKLKLAFMLGKHDTIGIDLVAMCVNDLVVCGATPLFFLDYYATGKIDLKTSKQIIEGILEGCRQANCALLGGETAEMPGFYQAGEYDLAGFSVGMVKNKEIIDGKKIKEGDILLALPSSGFHSNGYSLVRHIFGKELKKYAEQLLTPTKIYVQEVLKLKTALEKAKMPILGMAHITGSGLPGNVPRFLPSGVGAYLDTSKWQVPEIMNILQKKGKISAKEMYNTFNMGLGMVICVRPQAVKAAKKALPQLLEVGVIVKGGDKVILD